MRLVWVVEVREKDWQDPGRWIVLRPFVERGAARGYIRTLTSATEEFRITEYVPERFAGAP